MLGRLKRDGLYGGPPVLLGLAVLANYSSSAGRVMISPLVPAITGEFAVSNSIIGLALSGMWVAFASTQFPSGVLSDRFGERRLILVALGLITLGGVLVAAAPNFPAFVLGVVSLGGGSGFYLVASTSYLTKQFSQTGAVLGLHSTGASLGGLTIPVLVTAIAARAGWRVGLAVGAVVAAVTLALFARYSTESGGARPEMSVRAQFELAALREHLRRRGVAFTTLLAALSYFAYTSTASFFPTFLVEFWGLSTGAASVAFAAIFLVRSVCNPVLGRLSDQRGRDPLLAFCFVGAAVGYLVLLASQSTAVLVVGVGLLGVGMSFGGVITSRFMDDLGDAERGQGYGFANTIANIVGSAGSVVTGTIATVAGWPAAVGLLLGLLLVASLAIGVNRLLGLGV
jgi:YNFM family putative membrane transporter